MKNQRLMVKDQRSMSEEVTDGSKIRLFTRRFGSLLNGRKGTKLHWATSKFTQSHLKLGVIEKIKDQRSLTDMMGLSSFLTMSLRAFSGISSSPRLIAIACIIVLKHVFNLSSFAWKHHHYAFPRRTLLHFAHFTPERSKINPIFTLLSNASIVAAGVSGSSSMMWRSFIEWGRCEDFIIYFRKGGGWAA